MTLYWTSVHWVPSSPQKEKKPTGNHAFTLCGNLCEGTMREVNGIAIFASRAGISNGDGNRLRKNIMIKNSDTGRILITFPFLGLIISTRLPQRLDFRLVSPYRSTSIAWEMSRRSRSRLTTNPWQQSSRCHCGIDRRHRHCRSGRRK